MKTKVPVYGTIGKAVVFDTDAGAQIGLNLRGPDGTVLTVAQLRALLGLNGGVIRHRDLQGLQQGNDHPQYPLKAGREFIIGQWSFTQRIDVPRNKVGGPTYTASWPDILFSNPLLPAISKGRVAYDLEGSMHLSANAYFTGPASDWTRDDNASPSFAIELSILDGGLQFFAQPAGSGAFSWDATTAALQIMANGQSLFQPGSAANPPISFRGDGTTGVFSGGSDRIGFSVGGSEVANFNSASLDVLLLRTANGSAGTTAVGPVSDPNTGLFFTGSDQIAFSTNGVDRGNINNTAWDMQRARTLNGSAAAPAYGFFFEPGGSDTGPYLVADNIYGMSTGGALRAQFGNAATQFVLDNYELQIGAGADLRIFHDGANSHIHNDTGNLVVTVGGELDLEEVTTSTGANVPTLGANKPGSAVSLTPTAWLTIIVNGTTYYTPLWE